MPDCVQPLPQQCPWTPERWEALGNLTSEVRGMREDLQETNRKLDQLNHVRRRGLQAGAIGGIGVSGIGGIGILIWLWVKQKLGL